MDEDRQTGLVVVCGASRDAVARTAAAMAGPGVALVAHDLRGVGEGVVHRWVRVGDRAGTTVLELAHGCVSCTLREDLLPLLLRLAEDATVHRIVLLLDPGMEPEPVCDALHLVVPDGAEGPVADAVELLGVLGVLDIATWLDDAGGDVGLADRGLALTADDERTVAQIVVGHAEFADVLVLTGTPPDGWERVRLEAVLTRLAPRARRLAIGTGPVPDLGAVLDDLPTGSRRGRSDDPHGPLLDGQPPLARDAGVSLLHVGHRRPFHPQRLHEAFDVLLDGTVRIRGRLWVATQPENALWLESAGGGLQIGHAGRWLAADPAGWDTVDDERRAAAALRWDDRFGDREQQLAVLAHDADPAAIVAALDQALLTDEELAAGEAVWRTWDDPFGEWHTDPCDPDPGSGPDSRAPGADEPGDTTTGTTGTAADSGGAHRRGDH